MGRVFVLGSINCDLVIRAPYMPKSGETLSGGGFMINAGGKGANQAVACSKLGAETYMIGAVGDDPFGGICYDSLQKYGCSCKFVEKLSDTSTGVASIWVIDNDNRIVLDGGANMKLKKESVVGIIEEEGTAGDVLVCQLEIEAAVVEAAMRRAKEKGMTTILNPAPAAPLGKGILSATDILVPNETEMEILSGLPTDTTENLIRASAKLTDGGVGEIFVTLGKKGSFYYKKGETATADIVPIKAVDTTAAGDTTIGALAERIAGGHGVKESMRYCAAASALTVSRRGAQQSIPCKEEVEDFLKKIN